MVGYTLCILGQALAHNVETLLITRFLSGFFAVGPLNNGGGVYIPRLLKKTSTQPTNIGLIADIWSAIGRGPATSLYTASVFLGPVLGPIVSG